MLKTHHWESIRGSTAHRGEPDLFHLENRSLGAAGVTFGPHPPGPSPRFGQAGPSLTVLQAQTLAETAREVRATGLILLWCWGRGCSGATARGIGGKTASSSSNEKCV